MIDHRRLTGSYHLFDLIKHALDQFWFALQQFRGKLLIDPGLQQKGTVGDLTFSPFTPKFKKYILPTFLMSNVWVR